MTEQAPAQPATPQRSKWRHAVAVLLVIVAVYLVLVYVVIPFGWIRYEHRHPALDDVPGITLTGDDHPGDPLNVALIGSEADVKRILKAARWYPADALGVKSDLKIAEATVLGRPYDEAPVSSLYLFGRKEDLAYEQPVGDNPRQRNHVRFWKADKLDDQGRPLWIGSATYDERVGLSHTTGQVTHHISGDVDAERDHLFKDLRQTGDLEHFEIMDGFHKVTTGVNGGGDPWHTDGDLYIGTIRPAKAD